MSQQQDGVYRLPVTIASIKSIDRSSHWLSQGWKDFCRAPGVSLVYGCLFVVAGLALTVGLAVLGLDSLILPLAGGFAIVAPILVVGLYDLSRRLDAGHSVTVADCFAAAGRSLGQLAAMGVVLLVCYLVWVRVALLLFVIFFNADPPPFDRFVDDVLFSIEGASLLILGALTGAAFAAVVFSITAVSVPLIYDRPVDVLTAIGVSLLAVRENFRLMFGWAALIALIIAAGVATAFIGLAIAMPVLAFATWHAYRDLVVDGPTYGEDAPPASAGSASSLPQIPRP